MAACTFFGHRDCPETIKPKLREVLVYLITNHDVDMFYVGHQGQFDAYVHSELKKLKQEYPQINYAVVLAYMPGKKTEYGDYSDTMLPEGIESVHPHYAISWRNNWMILCEALHKIIYEKQALHLETEDVHLDDNYLLLRNTKNNTERMVPFSTSVEAALRQYSDYKEKIFGPKTKYFFANAGDSCWSKGTAYEQFRRILVRAQIPHTEKGPRLHDFRHTFAVHTLAEMSSQGLDLYYSLPILSKYLGHASLEATDHYVRLTAEMYPELLQQANQLCAYVFPEVSQVGV